METLAILTYKQPASKPEIDYVRGVDSDYALRRLLDVGLVDVVGRSDSVGRPLLYGTTARFLEEFGLSALDDLPNLREIEELLDDPAFNKERARLLMLSGLDMPMPSAAPEAPDGETEES
jgi:segregation and condensation protein B